MKKTILAFVMSVIMIAMASCGGGNHSKAFNQSKKILDKINTSIKYAKSCDDLDMAAFSFLGLLGVEGLDAITEAEQKELEELTNKMEKLMEQKRTELNCQEDNLWDFDEDDVPLDEPVEEME